MTVAIVWNDDQDPKGQQTASMGGLHNCTAPLRDDTEQLLTGVTWELRKKCTPMTVKRHLGICSFTDIIFYDAYYA
jgi:hypothetical protein